MVKQEKTESACPAAYCREVASGSARPWRIAITFGLLHGFGLAGALSEIGLPPTEIPLALACFNIGVEVRQLAFVAAILILIRAPRRRLDWPLAVRRMPAYAIGAVSAF
jgi:hypothetical protein